MSGFCIRTFRAGVEQQHIKKGQRSVVESMTLTVDFAPNSRVDSEVRKLQRAA